MELTPMGKCSRNRRERHQDRDVKHGQGPQAQPWTNPLSQPRPINDVLKNFRLSDLFTATPPGQGQGRRRTQVRQAQNAARTSPDTGSPAGTP